MSDVGAWHLDKRVPLVLVATIVLQSFAAVWWASAINERMRLFEASLLRADDQGGRIIKLEAQTDTSIKTLDRVEKKVDKILESDVRDTR